MMAPVTNQAVADILKEIGEYLAMQEIPFKPRAYEKAAGVIAGLEDQVADLYAKGGVKALREIPGVGASIAEKIEEYIKTGSVKEYEGLRKKTPVRLDELAIVEGLGPKSIQKLYKTLGVRTLKDLEQAAKSGKIAKLPGFGKKSEEKILRSIGFAKTSGIRSVLGFILPRVRELVSRIEKFPGAEKVTIAGSTRRMRDTVGDVDILAVSSKPKEFMDAFVALPEVLTVIAHGDTKSSIKIKPGVNVDLRVVPERSYGAALNYFTGSKDHNVRMRELAIKHGWKLNEYGLFKGEKQIAGETEENLYKAFGMDYVEPELRENTGEIEAAARHALPQLVGYGDLEGDLQVQTDWTDGSDSIEAMAKAAAARGLKYIAITDHTKRLAMTHGLDEKRLLQQMAEIDRLNKKYKGKIRILKGTECDILKDGSLDIADDVLAKLDLVGVSVHSYFNLPEREQTERVKRAISNPHADILFHPTGRVLNRRPPYEIDMDEIIRTAKKTGTVLEIDAYPDRSDLKDEHIRKCVEAGVRMSIDSDAHSPTHFPFLEYGIAQARRGWAARRDIINAWPLEKMLQSLK